MSEKSINIYGNRHPKRGALVANPIPFENKFWYDIFQPIVDAINKLYTGASKVFKSSETIWLGVDNSINVNKEIFNKIGGYSIFGGQNIPCATINGQQIIGNDNDIVIQLPEYTAGDNITIENGIISATDTKYEVVTDDTNGLMSSNYKSKLDYLINNNEDIWFELLKIGKPYINEIKYKTRDGEQINPYTDQSDIETYLPNITYQDYYNGIGILFFESDLITTGRDAFNGIENLIYIELPEGITTIGSSSFSLTNLTEITIPKSVIEIQDEAFAYCENLYIVKYNGTINDWGEITIGNDVFNVTNVTEIICINGIINL